MFVYGDEEGDICCEDIVEEEIEEATDEPSEPDAPDGTEIHAIDPEEGYEVSDSVPQTFLGGI